MIQVLLGTPLLHHIIKSGLACHEYDAAIATGSTIDSTIENSLPQ